jgi:uncharacterized protein (DUF924 family)
MQTTMGMGAVHEPDWVREVLDFWFGELGPRQWFSKSAELDARIRTRFGALHAQLLATHAAGVEGLRPVQAAVLVLDQFSRNLYREDARAFAGDASARRLARMAIDAGADVPLPPEQRMFLYLPFEHSEALADQDLSLRLYQRLGNEEWTRYARAHHDLIARFGRFPHRNALLGRESTPEEIAAMAEPMGHF